MERKGQDRWTGMLKFLEEPSHDNSAVAGNALDADSHTKPGYLYSWFRVDTRNIPMERIIMHLWEDCVAQ